ncbi:MAG: hypothetical protein ACLVEU_04785 [Bacteroides cellulosilyticus]
MLINGRTRHLLYQRLPAKRRNASYVVQRKGQTAQTMEYNVRIPYLSLGWNNLNQSSLLICLFVAAVGRVVAAKYADDR